MEETV